MYPNQHQPLPAYRAAAQVGLDDPTTVMRPSGRDMNASGVQRPSVQESPSTACPSSNMGWAAAALIFFWPLAFAAFGHAGRVSTLWISGDRVGAQHASDQAKKLGKHALIMFAVGFVLTIVLYVVVIASAVSSMSAYQG